MQVNKTAREEFDEYLEDIDSLRDLNSLSSYFKAWHTKVMRSIEEVCGDNSEYAQSFMKIQYRGNKDRAPELLNKKAFQAGLDEAKLLISKIIRFVEAENLSSENPHQNDVQVVLNLCRRFPRVIRQITTKYRDRKVDDIKDEYDVQHFFHSLLISQFDDIRPEDVSSNYGGASSRVDFLLKHQGIVVEIKKTGRNLRGKEIGEQLMIDTRRYGSNQEFKTLICFVYDPELLIANPAGLISDLDGMHDGIDVKVVISPQN
jgi:REase_DpnII-MboI